jgi:hypothetical protein
MGIFKSLVLMNLEFLFSVNGLPAWTEGGGAGFEPGMNAWPWGAPRTGLENQATTKGKLTY